MTNPLVSMFVFPAPQASYTMHSFPNELLWIPWCAKDKRPDKEPLDYATCKRGESIPAILLRSPAARYLVLYLHSNGEDIGLAYPFGCGLRMVLEVHVLLVEYPGYGICPGECSEETMWEVARSALRFATETLSWPLEDVIVMGRSIGASVAMRLASAYACHGLILVAPFLSLVDAVTQYIGALAPVLVCPSSFSNKEFVRGVNTPMLIIHGLQDRLINCSQGQQLWELCPHKKKLFVCPEQMSHNTDLLSNADFLIRPMLRFFALPDYSFVEMAIPPEAFDKRNCPQYHKLVETVKCDGPLSRPNGDEEGCPVGATACGPQSGGIGPCQEAGGDDDDLEGSNDFTVASPSWSPRDPTSQPTRSVKPSREPSLEVGDLKSVVVEVSPELLPFLEQLQPLAAMSADLECPNSKRRPVLDRERSRQSEGTPEVINEKPEPLQRSARATGLNITQPSATRCIAGPAREPCFPAEIGIDIGISMDSVLDLVENELKDGVLRASALNKTPRGASQHIDAAGSREKIRSTFKVPSEPPPRVCALGQRVVHLGSDDGYMNVPVEADCSLNHWMRTPSGPVTTVRCPSANIPSPLTPTSADRPSGSEENPELCGRADPPLTSSPRKEGVKMTTLGVQDNPSIHTVGVTASDGATHVDTGASELAVVDETPVISPQISPDAPLLTDVATRFEVDPVAVENDAEWAMPNVPVDTQLATTDPERAVHAGGMSTLMLGRIAQKYSHDANDAADNGSKTSTSPSGANDSADAGAFWEEGSTGAPPTAEVSHVSRRSEELSGYRTAADADCPVPGLCILNLDAGISKFLHEADSPLA